MIYDPATKTWNKIIRMRPVLRGFQDTEAFSVETFAGTAKRTSERILASEAACNPDYEIASLDEDKAFFKGTKNWHKPRVGREGSMLLTALRQCVDTPTSSWFPTLR